MRKDNLEQQAAPQMRPVPVSLSPFLSLPGDRDLIVGIAPSPCRAARAGEGTGAWGKQQPHPSTPANNLLS